MSIISWTIVKGAGWVRAFGTGISWTCHAPLFSERYGYRVPFLKLGRWRFFLLREPKTSRTE